MTLIFLGGTPLPINGAAGTQDIDTLKSLLIIYDVCTELQIEALEHAVLGHLADYDFPELDTFFAFAREVYGDTGSKKREVDSLVGKAVKLKLAALLRCVCCKRYGRRMSLPKVASFAPSFLRILLSTSLVSRT